MMELPARDSNPALHPRRALLAGVGGLAAGAFLAGQASAGPLNPPPGPVASTPGPEPRIPIGPATTPGDANSLYKITQPGSYYLTGNINGVSGRHGIEITASGVSLDLMGYDLIGAAGSLDGIAATVSGLSRVTVRNGHIRGWGGSGIDLATQDVSNCLMENLSLASNAQQGLVMGGSSVAHRCVATDNGGSGIAGINGCAISDCTASGNGSIGISAVGGAVVRHCASYSNVGAGIQVGQASTVTGCAAYSNLSWGFSAGEGCSVSHSTASNNADGFQVGIGSVVTECVAQSNVNNGFAVGGESTIQHCTARANGQAGISLAFRCRALHNTSVSNSGVGNSIGIFTPSSGNRIEGNYCAQNFYGILINGTNNIVVGNTCSGNTNNWLFQPNNVFGPIVDRRTPGTGQAFGNAVASSLGTTDPNANFSI